MPDYADWTDSIEVLGSEVMVPFDVQGAYIQVPMDLQGSYIQMPVDIQGQYITLDIDIVAQSVGDIAIDIAAQTVGNLNVNIAAQTGNVNVNIAASAVTLNVAIQSSAVTLNVAIQSSAVTLNVNIAAQTGNVNVNIAAQSGDVTIDVKAQTVAIKTQGEWSPQQGQQKYFVASATNVAFGNGTSGDYTVTAGKSLYITHFGFCVYAHAAADGDKDQVGGCSLYNATTTVNLAFIGGHGGNGLSFPTPIKIASAQVIRLSIATEANHACDVWACWGGYEL